jgi:hypothetical protein
MPRLTSRLNRLAVVGIALGLALGLVAAPPSVRPAAAAASLPAWDGGVNLYRSGVFTTQQSWLWCTAADLQIIRNIVEGDDDHSTANQRTYFDWMREHNKYDLPESAGVDPQGWTAGLRNWIDERYELVASSTFEIALRSAARNLRRSNLPVAVTVANGGHGWVLTGFTATADPATTDSFRVTTVRVTGPLYGLQSKGGYDMPPNTELSTSQFKRFFTPWHYDPKPMIWDGLYVSIQPIAPALPAPTPSPTAAPTPPPTPSPTPSPTAGPTSTPAGVARLEAATAAPSSNAVGAPTAAQSGSPAALLAVIALGLVLGVVAWRIVASAGRRGRAAR